MASSAISYFPLFPPPPCGQIAGPSRMAAACIAPAEGQTLVIKVQNKERILATRREATLAFGLAGLLQALIDLPRAAVAATAECELTVAPSGLAFCDRDIGTGPAATSGQLIKVRKPITFL